MLRLVLILSLLAGLVACDTGPEQQTAPPPTLEKVECDTLVSTALDRVGEICDGLGRNQACYGNNLVQVESQTNAETVQFSVPGDMTDLTALRVINTAPLDEAAQTWGVAVLKAQANLPDDLPGQNVTFLLYGGASLEGLSPTMNAVILKTNFDGITCADTPTASVIIQSPEGQRVSMNINGSNVTMGSTLQLALTEDGALNIATIEGSAEVEAFGVTQTVNPGTQVRLPIGEDNTVTGPPSAPQPFDSLVTNLPLNVLERPIQMPAPVLPTPNALVTSTVPPVTLPAAATVAPTACTPRTDWANLHTIAEGETLSTIALQYGLPMADLQAGNCITNPNLIAHGTQLRVPELLPTATPHPADPAFRADETSLDYGECTTLHWNAPQDTQVLFDGEAAQNRQSLEVCPRENTRYALTVIEATGGQLSYEVLIRVAEAPTDGSSNN
jgi:hypothetical protein